MRNLGAGYPAPRLGAKKLHDRFDRKLSVVLCLSRARILWRRFLEILNAAGSLLIFVVMVFLTVDIVGRIFFHAPLAGVPELSSMALISIVYLQLPNAVMQEGLVRSTLLSDLVAIRFPFFARALAGLFDLIGATVMLIIAYGAYPAFSRALANGDQYGTPGVFLFPQWPVRFLVISCCIIAAIQFLVLAMSRNSETDESSVGLATERRNLDSNRLKNDRS